MTPHDYFGMHLWAYFRRDFPIASRIPGFCMWAFGHYVKGYLEAR